MSSHFSGGIFDETERKWKINEIFLIYITAANEGGTEYTQAIYIILVSIEIITFTIKYSVKMLITAWQPKKKTEEYIIIFYQRNSFVKSHLKQKKPCQIFHFIFWYFVSFQSSLKTLCVLFRFSCREYAYILFEINILFEHKDT